MEPMFYVMAILGCGDAGSGCSVERISPARYATVAQCRADMTTVLSRNTDIAFPVVSAACRASGPQIVDAAIAADRG